MKKLLSIISFSVLLWCGCKDYLDIVPEGDIDTIETVFEQRSQVLDWVETCYSWIPAIANIPTNIGLTGADELVANDYLRLYNAEIFTPLFIGDGVQSASNPYGGKWENTSYYAAIRYCNTFLEHIGETRNMSQDEKDQWTAEVKAVKAFYYFELIRMYGPIILVPQNIGVNSSTDKMKFPRSHVDTCFNEVVRLLDEAIPVLYAYNAKELSRRGYFTKESALALKAKALVYQASDLFNGNEYYSNFVNKNGESLFSKERDKNKWLRAAKACDEAVNVCHDKYGWELVGYVQGETKAIKNVMADIEKSVLLESYDNVGEILFQAKIPNSNLYIDQHLYAYILPRMENDLWGGHYNEALKGCLSPSLKMVEMYYTENGLPIDKDRYWLFDDRYEMGRETDMTAYEGVVPEGVDVLNLHLKREPRFYACIAADRTYWQRGGEKVYAWERDNNLLVEAYRDENFGTSKPAIVTQAPQNQTGYWLKKHTYSSIKTDQYPANIQTKVNLPFPLMRMAELYLMQAEAWNEYLDAPDDNVYGPIDKVRTRAGIPDVRKAWREFSTDPDYPATKEGMRDIIRRETNIELAFEGHRFWNLRRWKIAHEELNDPLYGWNVLGKDAETFYNHGKPVPVWRKRKFVAPKDYLFPIRTEEVQVSGIKQNPGW